MRSGGSLAAKFQRPVRCFLTRGSVALRLPMPRSVGGYQLVLHNPRGHDIELLRLRPFHQDNDHEIPIIIGNKTTENSTVLPGRVLDRVARSRLDAQAYPPRSFHSEQVIGHKIGKAGVKIADHPAPLQEFLFNGQFAKPSYHLCCQFGQDICPKNYVTVSLHTIFRKPSRMLQVVYRRLVYIEFSLWYGSL